MKCKICGEETGDEDTICLRCSKDISDAEIENYHEGIRADMEVIP